MTGIWRVVRRQPLYGALSILTVALSAGAAVVVFSFVNALWLRPPPVSDPDRVAVVVNPSVTFDPSRLSVRALETMRGLGVFEDVAGQVLTRITGADLAPRLVIGAVGRRVGTIGVTPNYFAFFGLAVRGRMFSSTDNVADGSVPVVISDRLWRDAFDASATVVGRSVNATPVSVRIVGVAPAGFHGALRGEDVDVWVPYGAMPRVAFGRAAAGPASIPMVTFVRTLEGQPFAAARFNFQQALAAQGRPAATQDLRPLGDFFGAVDQPLVPVRDDGAIRLVAVIAGLLLLAGVVTLVATLLVHYERRRQELAIRVALGAGRRQLIRQMTLELVPVVVLGTAGALGLAYWTLRLLPHFALPGGVDLGRVGLAIDWRVLLAGVGACLAVVTAAAVVPLVRFTQSAMAAGTVAGRLSTPASVRLRQAVLGLHVALTIVLLVAAGLFTQSIVRAFANGPGFDAAQTLFVSVKTRPTWTWTSRQLDQADVDRQASRDAATSRVLLEELTAVPGVQSVALGGPLIGPGEWRGLEAAYPVDTDTGSYDLHAAPHVVSPEYFEALGIPLLAGRVGHGEEMVVSASLAAQAWPGESPLDRPLGWGPLSGTVVGVVDTAYASIRLGRPAVIFRQNLAELLPGLLADRPLDFVVRADDPDGVRRSVRARVSSAFPDAPAIHIVSGRELVEADLGRERLSAWFLSGVGAVAWLLGVSSVFGLVAYVAHSRRRDYGVMLALGADSRRLIRLAVGTALEPVAAGAVAGLAGALVLGRTVEAFLLGIAGVDLATYAIVFSGFVLTAAAAGVLAAWRLRRLSPGVALRTE